MASGVVRLSDVIVPTIFTPQVQLLTTRKSRLLQSGAVVLDQRLSNNLAGAGSIFNEPSFKDLDDDPDNVSSDDPAVHSSPYKIGSVMESQVRLARNQSWSAMQLAADLGINGDPMQAIANRVAAYWQRMQQKILLAMIAGIIADNAAAPSGGDTHTQNDLTLDISGGSFVDGLTNFSTEAAVNATLLMSDESDKLNMMLVHPVVYGRMRKNELIDFIPDSLNPTAEKIPTFLGMQVIQDRTLPTSGGVYESYIFGQGMIRMGIWFPSNASATAEIESAGNGGGQEVLYSRLHLIMHLAGHAYVGGVGGGGPTNASTSGNLAHADSWRRVYPEREMIRFARLVTREA